MKDEKAQENLLKTIDYFGGIVLMAKALDMKQSNLSFHKSKRIDERYDRLPPRFAVKVEKITAGRFKASDLAQVTFPTTPLPTCHRSA